MSEPITIVTSIFPSRIEAQQKAVASWLQLGFTVVSVNIESETDTVKPFFAGVDFIAIDRPPEHIIGSRVYLTELFSAIQARPGSVFGIVNSDICLKVDRDLPEFLKDNARDSLVYGSRIDVEFSECGNPKENAFGFDYFFFCRTVLPFVTDTGFCLGMPVWDYWLPIAGAVSGFPIKRLISPVAMHAAHGEAWTENEYDLYWLKLLEAVRRWRANGEEAVAPVWKLLPLIGNDWRDCAHFIRWYLYCQSEIITCCDNVDSGLIKGNDIYSLTKNDLSECLNEVASLRQQLDAISYSRSWKLTAPLRRLNLLLQGFFEKRDL